MKRNIRWAALGLVGVLVPGLLLMALCAPRLAVAPPQSEPPSIRLTIPAPLQVAESDFGPAPKLQPPDPKANATPVVSGAEALLAKSEDVEIRETTLDQEGQILRERIVRLPKTWKYPLARVKECVAGTMDNEAQEGKKAQRVHSREMYVADHILVKLKPGVPVAALERLNARFGSTIKKKLIVPDTFIVQLKDASLDAVPNAIVAYGKESELIVYAQPNHLLFTTDTIPNDPQFSQQWWLSKIQAPKAWDITKGSASVLVGVIDTGVDYNHPDLAANIWTNPGESGLDAQGRDKATNGVDDDGNGFIDDVHGWDFGSDDNDPMDAGTHGTHVAGIIGAVGGNGIGVAGVCWNVKIVPLKFGTTGDGGDTGSSMEALAYCSKIGVSVTNNSYGFRGGAQGDAFWTAIQDAGAHGQLFVAAAGNTLPNGTDNDASPMYPASYDLPNVISVAATDSNDSLAFFSHYGATSVDLGAPGYNILSTYPTWDTGGPYGYKSGTSMAAPCVAGVCALVKSVAPTLSVADWKQRILNGTDPLPELAGKCVTGGRVNAFKAVSGLLGIPSTPKNLVASTVSSTQINLTWTDNANNETGFKIERKTGAGGTWAQIATTGANVASYSNTGLASNTLYVYRVRATNGVGDSGYSNEASATTSNVVPTAPSNLVASTVTSTQINLTWTDNATNETGFKIERKTGAGGTWAQIATPAANAVSYSNTGLTSNTTYVYRVRATNAAGDSAYSNEASATTNNLPPTVQLTGPVNGASFAAAASITLTATASDPDGSVTKVEFFNGATKLGEDASSPYSFSWTNVPVGSYSLTAKATDNNGATATSSSVNITVTSSGPVGPPGYIYCANENQTYTLTGICDVAYGANGQFYYMYGLTGSITFDNATFGDPIYGIFKAGFYRVSPVPAAPSNLSATAASASQINLTWTDNASNETGFKIERKTGAAGTWAQIATAATNVTSYGNTGLASNTTYVYRVRATNTAGDSGYSNEASATTGGGVIGNGNGLRGEYFGDKVLSTSLLTRIDPTVNFDWGTGSPSANVPADGFSVRWTGQIQAQFTETYTIATQSDDGVRLWIGGNQIVNNWTDHAPTENSGTLALVAGQKYDIRIEYYENGGGAVAKLFWSSPSTAKRVVPQSQLYGSVSQLPVINGLALWVDASQVAGVTNGQQVNTWTDMSGLANHAIRQSGSSAGYPMYVANGINGKPVVRFNSANGNPGDYFRFNRISTIRTVFWVFKENSGLSDGRFLLGDQSTYHFHRGTANGPIWSSTYAHASVKSGTTRLNGTVVNGTTTAIPSNQFQVLSLVTAGNVEANQICQDRVYHGSWQGDIAEIIIYTTALSASEEAQVGSYLAAKYGLNTAYNNPNAALAADVAWRSEDIGSVAKAGCFTQVGETFIVSGSGADIGGLSDEYHFVYRPLSGDGSITARVTSLENTDPWAKAGVMIRQGLDANAGHVSAFVTPGGTCIQRRNYIGAGSQTTGRDAYFMTPGWVRIVRAGNNFKCYKSIDGLNWKLIGQVNLTWAADVYVGLAVTSHNDGTLSLAHFDQVKVQP